MTLHHPNYRTLHASESVRTQLEPLSRLTEADCCRNNSCVRSKLARRRGDGYEAGSSAATAALFGGMLMGAGSIGLIVWLATLVL